MILLLYCRLPFSQKKIFLLPKEGKKKQFMVQLTWRVVYALAYLFGEVMIKILLMFVLIDMSSLIPTRSWIIPKLVYIFWIAFFQIIFVLCNNILWFLCMLHEFQTITINVDKSWIGDFSIYYVRSWRPDTQSPYQTLTCTQNQLNRWHLKSKFIEENGLMRWKKQITNYV